MHTIASRDQQYSGTHEIYFIDLNAYTPQILLPTYILPYICPLPKIRAEKFALQIFPFSNACYCH